MSIPTASRAIWFLPLLALLILPLPAHADEAPAKAAAPAKAPKPVEGALPAAWSQAQTWRSIGPANMGGRITSLAVFEPDPTIWWAATASGGLIKTVNDGTTFEHQFDREQTVSVGCVAVAQTDANVVWVGTGEANPRNSVSWGNGVYKSTDGGATWTHMGLADTFHISTVRIHPENPDIVYVGAMGRCWGTNAERGLFKTTDAGKTWEKILYIDERTGVGEVRMQPGNPDTLLVATWERQRDGFDTNDPAKKWGPGSALLRSTDGGLSFEEVIDGLPSVDLGRIGIDFSKANPDTVFMVVESQKIGTTPPDSPYLGISGEDAEVGCRLTNIVAKGPAAKAGLAKGDIVLAVDGDRILTYAAFIRRVRQQVAGDTLELEIVREKATQLIEMTLGQRPEAQRKAESKQPARGSGVRRGPSPFSAALGGQRQDMQDQQGKDGHEYGGIYKSTDGGVSFTRVNSLNPRPMYFSEIRVDPQDDQRVYVLGIRLWRSRDGGATFTPDGHDGRVHPDHHAMWIDPEDPRHIILGNDGGVYVTRDRMANWDHLNHVAIGQFYHVGVGPKRDYRVYGGLQDNGSWGGPSRVRHGRGPSNTDWFRVGGGDGFRCLVDPNDAARVYFESQNGGVGRRHLASGERGGMRPRPPRGSKTPYRFNWQTPYLLSNHNSRIYYVAGNYVFRSLDRGTEMRRISPEITRTDRGSATALAESPRDSDLLYVGTDDGALWVTRDGGHTWTDLYVPPQAPEPKVQPDTVEGPVADDEVEGHANGDEAGQDGGGDDDAEDGPKPADPRAPRADPEAAKGEPKKPKDDGSRPIHELVPERRWVSWIEPSRVEAQRAYLVLDGHRSDDGRAHVFVTENGGETWRSIVSNLPASAGTTRVLCEDIAKPDVLYLGTEFGAWVSIDRGASWTELGNLPTVAVHAFAQHRTSGEIVVATHGRSLWVMDVTALRQMDAKVVAEDVHLFAPNTAIHWRSEPGQGAARAFVGQNPPSGAQILFSLKKKSEAVALAVTSLDGKLLRELEADGEPGLHVVAWDLRAAGKPGRDGRMRAGRRVTPGVYRVVLTVGEAKFTQDLAVEIDPEFPDPSWIARADEQEAEDAERAHAKWAEKHGPFEGDD